MFMYDENSRGCPSNLLYIFPPFTSEVCHSPNTRTNSDPFAAIIKVDHLPDYDGIDFETSLSLKISDGNRMNFI